MTDKKQFRVTESAGQYVSGRRVKAGDVIELSTNQADYELILGSIEPHTPAKSPRVPEGGGSVDRVTRGGEIANASVDPFEVNLPGSAPGGRQKR